MRVGSPRETELGAILAARAIHSVFQPIVALPSGETVGYEALARGPEGALLYQPDALFAYAARVNQVPELDWVCRAAACRGALDANLPPDIPLFVNIEPVSARMPCPADLIDVMHTALDRLQIVAEVTERRVDGDPAGLLAAVTTFRAYGNRIALDDVGIGTSSQAMMSLIRPDIIKLDRTIVQGRLTPAISELVNSVQAEAERSGAMILAEGIETPDHAIAARSMGATLGQGWLFGRPGPLPSEFPPRRPALPQIVMHDSDLPTPFEIARSRRPVMRATKEMVLRISRHIEDGGLSPGPPTILLATFQDASYFGDRIRSRYRAMAAEGILTAVFAAGELTDPGPHIRACELSTDDPLVDEWAVIVIGSHFTGAVFAKELPTTGGEDDREFDVVVSYDRDLILAAARPLVQRLRPI